MWLLPGKVEKGDWGMGRMGDGENGRNGEAEQQGYFK